MTPRIIILTALMSLGANKLRAGLTLLGIVIGVAAFVTLMAIGRGAQQSITSNIESLGSNLLFVTPLPTIDGTSSLTLEDAEALVDPVFAPAVVQVAPEISSFGFIVAGRVSTGGEILGVTPSYESVRLFPVASGQFISRMHVDNRSTVAVLGSQVSETLFGLRDPVGQTIRINDRQFTVIGVLESKGGSAFGSQDYQVLTPITTAYYRLSSQRTTQGSITVQTITVQVTDADLMDAAQRQVETILHLRHRITAENDFYVRNQQEIIETLEEATEVFVIFLAAIAGISLLVGGIGIMNIMLVSVTERTREIGIRKAVGAKRRDILLQFLSEATILSIGGGVVGVILGIVLARVMDRVMGDADIQTVASGDVTVLALIVSAAIGLFFGIYPAMRAARLHPIEALRYE